MKLNLRRAALTSSLAFACSASAAQYCVSNEAGLLSALNSAAASVEPDEIRFVQGGITISSDMAPNQINGALSLRGGYANGCAQRPNTGSKTVLKGSGRNFRLFLNDDNLLLSAWTSSDKA